MNNFKESFLLKINKSLLAICVVKYEEKDHRNFHYQVSTAKKLANNYLERRKREDLRRKSAEKVCDCLTSKDVYKKFIKKLAKPLDKKL